MAPRGMLLVRRALPRRGELAEERLPFSDLQGLIDLCASRAQGAAFVQVEVAGTSGGRQCRLVLDFGQFGADAG